MSWRTCFRKADLSRSLAGLTFILLVLFTIPSAGQSTEKPLDCTQLIAWLTGGVSSHRLSQLVQERSIAFTADEAVSKTLLTAGADAAFIQNLHTLHALPMSAVACPATLAQAGDLIRHKQHDEADRLLRKLVAADPRNAALHFAYGYLRQQQEDWDGAFDEYSDSRDLMPGSSETHSRLAYIYYRHDDGDNAIAEARTALSIDPRNAEAYRYLGLGHYANDQYAAALRAFQQSLAREPRNADVYYDMGITLRDKGDRTGAAAAYRQALALNPTTISECCCMTWADMTKPSPNISEPSVWRRRNL